MTEYELWERNERIRQRNFEARQSRELELRDRRRQYEGAEDWKPQRSVEEIAAEVEAFTTIRVYTNHGECFPGVDEAAAAVGTDRRYIQEALKHPGRRRFVMDRLWSYLPLPNEGRRCSVMSDRGERWHSLRDAAKALDTSDQSIRRRILDGGMLKGRKLMKGPHYQEQTNARARRRVDVEAGGQPVCSAESGSRGVAA